ncbi:uncharacterized protein LOC143566462 [Bidens hawaiensis]|uniref:uncharacterized protein LOC143566462 n=1 Tax=Bidens hawaiensis TaxID=980011 RepID=UPI004049D342
MSLVTQQIRASATHIYHGDAICQEKSKLLLREMGLPNGLLTLKDIVEFGYVKDTGFVWLIQKKANKCLNEKIGKLASNATEVTCFVEKFHIKKLTGVKGRSFPVSAFEIDDVKKDVGDAEVAKDAGVKEV